MPTITIDDCEIHYELFGQGPPIVLTPGGRSSGAAVQKTAEALAERYQIILWDRRNTGSSSVWFGLETEQFVWADDLAALLRHLRLAPAYLAGASGGARVSYLAAIRHPDVAAGLILWSVSGGAYACQNLGYEYHTPFINAANRGGMESVAETPFFRERIEAYPSNRSRILSASPQQFVAALRRWNESYFFNSDAPVIAATTEELRTIRCPTLVFEGNDDLHTHEASVKFHEAVTGSELVPLPWSKDEWMDRYLGRVPGSVTDLYPRLVPTVLDFLARVRASE